MKQKENSSLYFCRAVLCCALRTRESHESRHTRSTYIDQALLTARVSPDVLSDNDLRPVHLAAEFGHVNRRSHKLDLFSDVN